jgi:hypothetical protein
MTRPYHTCAQPGCGARVLKHDRCEHHREKPRHSPPERRSAEERHEYAQRRQRRRARAGLPGGWEGL